MKDRLCIALLLAVVALAYGNSLLNQFTLDDGYYIVENPHVTNPSVQGMFEPQTYTKVFRPVTFATLALNWNLAPGQPFGFHLFNVILHALVTLLLYLLLQTIFSGLPGRAPFTQADLSLERNATVFAAAALFAVHPIHTEAVSSIVGRSELLAAGFLFALLSKESAAVFLPLILIVDYARNEWKPRVHYFLFVGVTLAYLGLLWRVHG